MQSSWLYFPKLRYILLAVVVVACVFKLFNVFNGVVHWDTNLYLNIAQGYFERGILTPPMWRYNPEWNIVAGAGAGYGIFILLAWVRLFGITVLSGHLLMYLVGLINLPLIYLLGTRWFRNSSAGWWAVAFFACTNTFAADYYVRMDALSILTTTILLLIFLTVRERKNLWLWALLGFLSVLALEIHLLTIYSGCFFTLITITDYIQEVRTKGRLILPRTPMVAFGAAGLIGATLYVLIHIAPNPTIYLLIPAQIARDPTPRVWKELYRWVLYTNEQTIPLMALIGVGLFSAIVRRTQPDRLLLLLAATSLVAFTALGPPYQTIYTGQLLPIFTLLVAGLLSQGLNIRRRSLNTLAVTALIILTFALVVRASNTAFAYARQYAGLPYIDGAHGMTEADYIRAIDYIHAHIDPTTVIMGPALYYVDVFNYHNYLSYFDGEVHGIKLRGETKLDFWLREQPRAFIGAAQADPELMTYFERRGGFVEVVPFLWIDKALGSP